MAFGRDKGELNFAAQKLAAEIKALEDPETFGAFLEYASSRLGTSQENIRARIYHVKQGRTPTTPIALILHEFSQIVRIRRSKQMKTYIVDWNGRCAVVRAADDEGLIDAVEPALADPTYPFADTRILEVPDNGVVDIKPDGTVSFVSDMSEPQWFRLIHVGRGKTGHWARHYIPLPPEGWEDEVEDWPTTDPYERAVLTLRHLFGNDIDLEKLKEHIAADDRATQAGMERAQQEAEETKRRIPLAAFKEATQNLDAVVGYRAVDLDDDPISPQLCPCEAIFSKPKDALQYAEMLLETHQVPELKADAMDEPKHRSVKLWEALQALEVDDLVIDAPVFAQIRSVLEKLQQLKSFEFQTSEKEDLIKISLDIENRRRLDSIVWLCLNPSKSPGSFEPALKPTRNGE